MLDKRRIFLLLAATALLVASWLPLTNTSAETTVKEGLTRSLTAFGIARTLGAGVSVLQSFEVKAGFGVSGSVGLGEALQPLNELIDHFSDVMLAASVSLGIQQVLLKIGAHWAVSLLVTIGLAYWLFRHWGAGEQTSRALQGALLLILLVRFAAPAAVIGSDMLYEAFMANGDATEVAQLEQAKSLVQHAASDSDSAEAPKKRSLLERLDPRKAVLAAATNWPATIAHLIASFLLQTVLFPLLFLGLAWWAMRGMLAWMAPGRPGLPVGQVTG